MARFNKLVLLVVVTIFVPAVSVAVDYALDECLSKADEGVAEAQWQLGQRYENGNGVRKNDLRAVSQYKKAAEQKHRKACAKLAELYELGRYVKQDAVLAAKYRAWASGDNGELAAARERTAKDRDAVDEVEMALDYVFGRNGKNKDPKTGIRILFQNAKGNPSAQRAFVNAWNRGGLDDALMQLSNAEWDLVVPWFRDAYKSGMKSAGQILGNDAYAKKRYRDASAYWKSAAQVGNTKCWVFYAKLYDEGRKLEDGGGPKSMQSDERAKDALEHALRANPNDEVAAYMMASICTYSSKKKCLDYARARDIFKYFYEQDPGNMWRCWNYGFAGFQTVCAVQYDNLRQLRSDIIGHSYAPSVREQKYQRYLNLKEDCIKVAATWIPVIQRAADLGCEPAQRFIKDFYDNK